MIRKLRTSVEFFSLVDGELQEKAPNISVSERSAVVPQRKGRGSLYVLVETIGSFPDHAQAQRQIVGIVQEYFHTSGSITAGIRAVIKAANVYLFEENLNAPREQRGVAGVTCVVLKDQDAYIGQLGPALLYHIGKGVFQILPRESTWLTCKKLEDVDISRHPPLGVRRDVEPELFHLRVQEGDILILASTPLAKLASKAQMASTVAQGDAHSVCENLEMLARGRDISALVIEIRGVSPTFTEATVERPEAAHRHGVWRRISSAIREMLVPAAGEAESAEEMVHEEVEKTRALPQIDLKNTLRSIWRSVADVGRKSAILLSRMLPEPEAARRPKRPYTHKDKERTPARVDAKWLWIALLIPLVIVLLLAFSRFQHERARQTHFRQLVQGVEEAKLGAEASATVEEQRTKINEALTLLAEALKLKPQDTSLVEQQKAMLDWLDRINHVKRIYVRLLKEFPDTETAQCALSTLIIHEKEVYVLDVGIHRVYKYLLNETGDELQVLPIDPVLLRRGEVRDNVTVGELLGIAWVEAGFQRGTSALLILDKGGHTFEHTADTQVKALKTADIGAWRKPVAIAGYYGRLYVLDPGANQLLRYGLTNAGYDGSISNYFKALTDIHDAVGMAIDGYVYVLHADGRISKYQDGLSVPFPQNNLDEPLRKPTCIFASGFMDEGGYVYVADAENQRIVQYSKAGDFIYQFRTHDPSEMNALKSLFVHEDERKLYLINGNKLYFAPLPE